MSKNDQRIEALFRDLDPPDPPSEMRSQVLEPALAALQQGPVPDIWTRIWSSRPLRLAWTTSLSALVLFHLSLSMFRVYPDHQHQPETQARGITLLDEEVAELLQLPPLRTDVPPRGSRLPDAADENIGSINNNSVTDKPAAITGEDSA